MPNQRTNLARPKSQRNGVIRHRFIVAMLAAFGFLIVLTGVDLLRNGTDSTIFRMVGLDSYTLYQRAEDEKFPQRLEPTPAPAAANTRFVDGVAKDYSYSLYQILHFKVQCNGKASYFESVLMPSADGQLNLTNGVHGIDGSHDAWKRGEEFLTFQEGDPVLVSGECGTWNVAKVTAVNPDAPKGAEMLHIQLLNEPVAATGEGNRVVRIFRVPANENFYWSWRQAVTLEVKGDDDEVVRYELYNNDGQIQVTAPDGHSCEQETEVPTTRISCDGRMVLSIDTREQPYLGEVGSGMNSPYVLVGDKTNQAYLTHKVTIVILKRGR